MNKFVRGALYWGYGCSMAVVTAQLVKEAIGMQATPWLWALGMAGMLGNALGLAADDKESR